MSKESNKILNYIQGQKSIKTPLIIYADTESLLNKCMHVKVVQKIYLQQRVSKHTACGF